MNYKPVFERLNIQAEELFKQATFEEFFGRHMLEFRDRDHYVFSSDEKGDAVSIVERRSHNQEPMYEVKHIPEEKKLPPNPIILRPCPFSHCEEIPGDWLEDSRTEDIKTKINRGGKSLGKKLNKAFIDVLFTAASSKAKTKAQDNRLDEALANIYSSLAKEGFRLNVFLFPEHLEAKLVQQGIINRDQDVRNTHYVGTTLSNQAAYWSSDLPNNTALIFDSSIGLAINRDQRFYIISMGAFTPGVCGHIRINPIIKNTTGIVAIEGIDRALDRRRDEAIAVQPMTAPSYVDLDRIDELRGIPSKHFDLTKLIEFCEEINKCYTNESYFAVAMLVRAVLDHVPPIFNCKTFAEVTNNCGGKSLKKSLQNLQNSSRSIADAYLHLRIRNKEALPNKTQVNFSNDLDVLLAEIIRVLK